MKPSLEKHRLVADYYEKVRQHYPEIVFIRTEPHPEDPDDTWLMVQVPDSWGEERYMEMCETAAEYTTDILLETGYYMSLHLNQLPSGMKASQPSYLLESV